MNMRKTKKKKKTKGIKLYNSVSHLHYVVYRAILIESMRKICNRIVVKIRFFFSVNKEWIKNIQ